MAKEKAIVQRLSAWIEERFWSICLALIGLSFSAGVMLADASAYGARLDAVEADVQKAKQDIAGIDGVLKGMKDRVDDIAAFLRVPKDYGKPD